MGYERIEDDVYVFSSDLYAQVTAGLVFTNAGAVLIDTLPFPRETQSIAQFERRRGGVGIRYVVNTHHHSDHVYGNYLFPRAKIIAHERGRAILQKDGQESLDRVKAAARTLGGYERWEKADGELASFRVFDHPGALLVAALAALASSGVAIPRPRPRFGHGAVTGLEDGTVAVLASYHPSRQNTQTGRLTPEMFDAVWSQVRALLT